MREGHLALAPTDNWTPVLAHQKPHTHTFPVTHTVLPSIYRRVALSVMGNYLTLDRRLGRMPVVFEMFAFVYCFEYTRLFIISNRKNVAGTYLPVESLHLWYATIDFIVFLSLFSTSTLRSHIVKNRGLMSTRPEFRQSVFR